MRDRNGYHIGGAGLLLSGAVLSLASFLIIEIDWLTALGIAMLILGVIMLALAQTVPKISPEVCGLLLETGMENIAALIEELGISSRAIYLPSSLAGGRPQAFIPVQSGGRSPVISRKLPQRLIVRSGPAPEDIGLLVSTVGSTAAGLLDAKPGSGSTELESALTYLLSGILGVADRVRVHYKDTIIKIEITNPRLRYKISRAHQFVGEPLSSIAATLCAEALDKPVMITEEKHNKSQHEIALEVIGGNL